MTKFAKTIGEQQSSSIFHFRDSDVVQIWTDLDSIAYFFLDVEFYAHFSTWFGVPLPPHMFYNALVSPFFLNPDLVQIWTDLDSIAHFFLDVDFYAHFSRWFGVHLPPQVFYNVLASPFFLNPDPDPGQI